MMDNKLELEYLVCSVEQTDRKCDYLQQAERALLLYLCACMVICVCADNLEEKETHNEACLEQKAVPFFFYIIFKT